MGSDTEFGDELGTENMELTSSIYRLSLWVGAWSIAWATTLASMLPRPTHPLARRPILLTSFFLVTPCLLFAIVTPLIVIANARFNDLFNLYKTLDSDLTAASEAVDQGKDYDSSAIPVLFATLARLRDEELVPAWRSAWIALGVLTTFMLVVRCFAFAEAEKQLANLFPLCRSSPSPPSRTSPQSAGR